MITVSDRKSIAKLVLTTSDDSIIKKIKALLNPAPKANEAYLKKYNQEIDEAVKEIKAGKYFTQKQAEMLLAEWEKK